MFDPKDIKGVNAPTASEQEEIKATRMDMIKKAQDIAREEIQKTNESNPPF